MEWQSRKRALEIQELHEQELAQSENECVICHEYCTDVTTDAFGILLGHERGNPPRRDSRCYMLQCQHYMHIECIRQWIFQHGNTSCPVCRQTVSAFDLASVCMRRAEPQFHSIPSSLTKFMCNEASSVFASIQGDVEFDPSSVGSHFESETLNQFGDEMTYSGIDAAWTWGSPASPQKYTIGNSRKSFIRVPITRSNLSAIVSVVERFYDDNMHTPLWEIEPTVGVALSVVKGVWKGSIHLSILGDVPIEEKYTDVTGYFIDYHPHADPENLILGPLLPIGVAAAHTTVGRMEAKRNASIVALMRDRVEVLLNDLST